MLPPLNESLADQSAEPFHRGEWVAQIQLAQPTIGMVKDVYALDGEWLVDVVVWSWNGKKLGRVSPPEGGPKTYEPACPAKNYCRIEKPKFPLRRGLSGEYDRALVWA